MHNFLNLHVLFTTNAANPNRDDTGTPKQCTYGGVIRSRMSSQSMTRAKRITFETMTGGDQISFRAKTGIVDKAVAYTSDLARRSGNPLTADETAHARSMLTREVDGFVKKLKKDTDSKKAKQPKDEDGQTSAEESDADGKKDTLVWLAEPELRRAAEQALAKLRGEGGDLAFLSPEKRTMSLAIAAFGRMFAARPELQNEAAIQRSHAFTTHESEIDPDYFTAVNDLPEDDEGRGAGHLGISQLTGGVYYWHCNIDRDQLWATWIEDSDDSVNRERLASLFTALLTALPSGKQNTSAHKTLPDAVLAVEASQPVALHQAFEAPVAADRKRGYRHPSVEALLDTQRRLTGFSPSVFGSQRVTTTLDLDSVPDPITHDPGMDDLITGCVEWVMEGKPTNRSVE